MHQPLSKDVQKSFLETVLPWLFGFLLAAVVILGYVRLYELRLKNQESREQVEALSEELGQLKKQRAAEERALEHRAAELGLYRPSPEEIVLVHVGRAEECPGTREYMGRNEAYSEMRDICERSSSY